MSNRIIHDKLMPKDPNREEYLTTVPMYECRPKLPHTHYKTLTGPSCTCNYSLGDGERCYNEDTVRPGVPAIVATLELCILIPAGVLWRAPWLLDSCGLLPPCTAPAPVESWLEE